MASQLFQPTTFASSILSVFNPTLAKHAKTAPAVQKRNPPLSDSDVNVLCSLDSDGDLVMAVKKAQQTQKKQVNTNT